MFRRGTRNRCDNYANTNGAKPPFDVARVSKVVPCSLYGYIDRNDTNCHRAIEGVFGGDVVKNAIAPNAGEKCTTTRN